MRKKISSIAVALSLVGLFAFSSSNAGECDWDPTNGNTERGICVIGGPTAECDTEFENPPYYNCTKVISQN